MLFVIRCIENRTMKFTNAAETIFNDVLEEENAGYEVAARLPPPAPDADAAAAAAAEMVPDPEEPDDFEEEENAPAASNRSSTKNRLFGLLSLGVAVVMAVGVAWSVKSPASSKTNISSNMLKAAAPIDDYIKFGVGYCKGTSVSDPLGEDEDYPYVAFKSVNSLEECAEKCQCAQGIKGVKHRGLNYDNDVSGYANCECLVDWLDDFDAKDLKKIEKLNDACRNVPGLEELYFDDGSVYDASGEITSLGGGGPTCSYSCYAFKSIKGYSQVGQGVCISPQNDEYSYVYFTNAVATADRCAEKCECTRRVKGVKHRGFAVNFNECLCYVDWLDPANDQAVIADLNTACAPDGMYDGCCPDSKGKVESSTCKDPDYDDFSCFKLGKAGKEKGSCRIV